jgi:hypothetical protein
MSGDVHVQFCEQRLGKFLALTHLVFIFQRKDDAKRFYSVLPKRLNKYGLILHTEKSHPDFCQFLDFHKMIKKSSVITMH